MMLADTSVWVDHLRGKPNRLGALLEDNQIVMHPWVMGEIALGHLRDRAALLDLLTHLPQATLARDDEVMHLIHSKQLAGKGLGWVDVHLLASLFLMPGVRLWTLDKALHKEAQRLGLA